MQTMRWNIVGQRTGFEPALIPSFYKRMTLQTGIWSCLGSPGKSTEPEEAWSLVMTIAIVKKDNARERVRLGQPGTSPYQ